MRAADDNIDPTDLHFGPVFSLQMLRNMVDSMEHAARLYGKIDAEFDQVNVRVYGEHGIPRRVEMTAGKLTLSGDVNQWSGSE